MHSTCIACQEESHTHMYRYSHGQRGSSQTIVKTAAYRAVQVHHGFQPLEFWLQIMIVSTISDLFKCFLE